MSTVTLEFERETVRNLAGPELFMQTALEPMDAAGLEEINGGSLIGGLISAAVSGAASYIATGPRSAGASAQASALVSELAIAA